MSQCARAAGGHVIKAATCWPEFSLEAVSLTDLEVGAQSGAAYAQRPDGSFAIAVTSADTAATGTGIRVRFLSFDGTPVSNDFVVPRTAAGDQSGPAIAGLNDGSLLVTWRTPDPDVGGNSLLTGRRISADGAAHSDEVRLSASGADGSYSFIQRSNGMLLLAYQNDGEIVRRACNAARHGQARRRRCSTTSRRPSASTAPT
jgi:hypothetical protein